MSRLGDSNKMEMAKDIMSRYRNMLNVLSK